MELYAPKEFWELSLDERQGKCGAGEGLGEKLVPDNILGLWVRPACSIHDFMQEIGETHEDFKESNRVFHNNLYRIIDNKGGWLKRPRYVVATGYYLAVSSPIGSLIYWKNKNKKETMGRFYNNA